MNVSTFRDILKLNAIETINGTIPPTVVDGDISTAARPFVFIEDIGYTPCPGFLRLTMYKIHLVTGLYLGPSEQSLEQWLGVFEDQGLAPCAIERQWESWPDSPEPERVTVLTFTLDTNTI